jgi:hypothetical protein
MIAKVLVHVERVDLLCIEARKIHVHDKQHVHTIFVIKALCVPLLNSLRNVFVVAIEGVAILRRILCIVKPIVVTDKFLKLVPAVNVAGIDNIDVEVGTAD